ncbi:DUF3144 domain-containing protein [Marinibactrum halimedae]|uniref:DUF3144 domain-containing protein n=1 Tax=Marinibactrum halimedae TaxID=1444977 RepID=A0AA37T9V3_9GAMM|nr:DUF3144 domain-containing protein [Marinibactrum halimedae]MCD9459379.1 DUF3144 domain-containing protein [Marinibactrum halimedae]GLS27557.1 hypothetical protein GCM10007877_32760 [Marinibactrum halimedae]
MTEDNTTQQHTTDEKIFDLADRLIEVVNEATDTLSAGEAHQALMYASARFGAFIVAGSSQSRNDFKEDQLAARNFYMDQFRRLLTANFDEYLENYKEYVGQDTEEHGGE